jgi:hypothetical protein
VAEVVSGVKKFIVTVAGRRRGHYEGRVLKVLGKFTVVAF